MKNKYVNPQTVMGGVFFTDSICQFVVGSNNADLGGGGPGGGGGRAPERPQFKGVFDED